ncbi:MAG: DNA-directed DNA polymerase [Candidatus Aenigmatarchaeota archaeon]
MKLCLLDVDYFDEDGRSVIRLFCKDRGKTVVCLDYDFYPYFYILPIKGKEREVKKMVENIRSVKIRGAELVERLIDGQKRKFVKVFCFLSTDVTKVRDVVKLWKRKGFTEGEREYTINFYRRYLIDKQISGMGFVEVEDKPTKGKYQADNILKIRKIKPVTNGKIPKLKLLAFDIECVGEKIVMISFKGDKFKKVITYQKSKYPKHVKVVRNEKELLENFVDTVQDYDPDIILGYNSDMFDMQFIQKRADELKVDLKLSRDFSKMKFSRRARTSTARLKGRVHVDLFVFINNVLASQLQTEVLSLDAVSSELLGDKKIEIEYQEILESWKTKKHLAKLAEYCLKDSELTLKLGYYILPQIYSITRMAGQSLFDVSRMMYSQLVEWHLSKRAFQLNHIIPSQPKWDEIQRRREMRSYVGGFVKEPIGGLHENIAVLDFKSLYPSIIASFNISPETLNCKCCRKKGYEVPGTDYWFCKKKKGFVSKIIQDLIEKRVELKGKMKKYTNEYNILNNEQFAVKTIANATYGYFGFPGSKWYCRQCAEAAATFGRFYIKKVIDEAVKEKFTVVYGDTDSLFVKTSGNLNSKVKTFLKRVNKLLPGILELDLQGIYMRGIFIPRGVGPGTAKKRYALIDKKGVLTVRGLEKVRRDWSNVAKDTQEEVLKLILMKEDVKGSIRHVQKVISNLKKGKIPLKDLIIYEQLVKNIDDYKLKSPHVSAAKRMRESGEDVYAGMIIMFVITKGKGSISDRAKPIEHVKLNDIDNNYYIGRQIIPAALRVLTVLNVTEEDLLGQSLKSFIKK